MWASGRVGVLLKTPISHLTPYSSKQVAVNTLLCHAPTPYPSSLSLSSSHSSPRRHGPPWPSLALSRTEPLACQLRPPASLDDVSMNTEGEGRARKLAQGRCLILIISLSRVIIIKLASFFWPVPASHSLSLPPCGTQTFLQTRAPQQGRPAASLAIPALPSPSR